MEDGIRVVIRHDEEFYGTKLWIMEVRGDERRVAMPVDLVMTPMKDSWLPEPTIQFRGDSATKFLQQLSDGLSEIGFKPVVVKDMTNELTAVRYHLEDMRTIVLKSILPAKVR